jgi:hypothetical protein
MVGKKTFTADVYFEAKNEVEAKEILEFLESRGFATSRLDCVWDEKGKAIKGSEF